MKSGTAFWAGVLAAAIMSVLMALARALGISVHLEMTLGSLFTGTFGAATWILGFIVHLLASGLVALLYGLAFEYVTHRAGWGMGDLVALVHIVIAGFFFALIPAIHPLIPEALRAPGAFMANLGFWGVVAFIVLHLVYGGIVGAVYRPVIHGPRPVPGK